MGVVQKNPWPAGWGQLPEYWILFVGMQQGVKLWGQSEFSQRGRKQQPPFPSSSLLLFLKTLKMLNVIVKPQFSAPKFSFSLWLPQMCSCTASEKGLSKTNMAPWRPLYFCRKTTFTWLLQPGLGFSAAQTAPGPVCFKSNSFLAKYLQRAAVSFSFLSGIFHSFCLTEFLQEVMSVKIIFSFLSCRCPFPSKAYYLVKYKFPWRFYLNSS